MTPRSKPKLGQNFLRDDRARRAIVDALGDISQRTVVEIGPGLGAITRLLAERAGRLIAIELDRSLAAGLRTAMQTAPNVSIVEADVLKVDLPALIAESGNADIVGNLPYYITSDILLWLFAVSERMTLGRAVLMMQREVAERVVAPPGGSDYGVLSATTQLHASAELLFTLPPDAFTPPPEVDSAVVRFHFRSRFRELNVDRAGFLRFVRVSFAQKRKTLANNLRAAGYPIRAIETAWPASITHHTRAEAVPLESMADLYRSLHTAPILESDDA